MIPESMFVDREADLRFLEKKYRSDNPELITIYGRRRVGKTRLLQEGLMVKLNSLVTSTI